MGLRFSSVEDRSIVSKVLLAASIMTALQVGSFALNALSSHSVRGFESATTGLLTGLLLPACGYFGAKNSNRWLMGAFCGFSWCTAVCSGIAMLLFVLAFVNVQGVDDVALAASCTPENCIINAEPVNMDFPRAGGHRTYTVDEINMNCTHMRNAFAREHYNRTAEELRHMCEQNAEQAELVFSFILVLMFICMLPNCILGIYAGWHGAELHKRLERGESFVMEPHMDPAMLSTVPLQAQPAVE